MHYFLFWCLCRKCPICKEPPFVTFKNNNLGTMVVVTHWYEVCHYSDTWRSQPYLGDYPAGNILLSAAILFTGASIAKTLRIFNHINIYRHSYSSYMHHQKDILAPVILSMWKKNQNKELREISWKKKKVKAGSDACNDSPGHIDKFGSFRLMELETNKILVVQLVQVSSVSLNFYFHILVCFIKHICSSECGVL